MIIDQDHRQTVNGGYRLTIFRALAVELVCLELVGEREEDAARRVRCGVLTVGAGDALVAGRRNGSSEGKETNRELENHCVSLRKRLRLQKTRSRRRVPFHRRLSTSFYTHPWTAEINANSRFSLLRENKIYDEKKFSRLWVQRNAG